MLKGNHGEEEKRSENQLRESAGKFNPKNLITVKS
jgi:hypothetical protein